MLPDERQEFSNNPLQVQHVKAQARIKANQLCKFVLLKVQEGYRQKGDNVRLNLNLSDIKLYFFCKNGKRWYFEGGQRICHILQEKYWTVEKTIIPHKPGEINGDANGASPNEIEFSQRKSEQQSSGKGEFDFQSLLKNYKPRELTELERIYVIFSREGDLNS